MVNGGNRYSVRLYAYEAEEGSATKVVSEPVEIQLTKIPDTQIYSGLINTNGEIMDITDSASWQGGSFVPRSSDSAYSWGLISITGSYAFKFGLLPEMLEKSASSVKLYYVESYYTPSYSISKIGTTELAYGTKTYFIAPNPENELLGLSLDLFADYSFTSKYTKDPWNMPTYNSNGELSYPSLDKPSSMGISLYSLELKGYIFNNAVYIGVDNPQSNEGKAIGLSYKY